MDHTRTEDDGPDPIQPKMTRLTECNCPWCPEGKSNRPTVELNAYGPGAMAVEICEVHLREALALFSN